MIKVKKTTYKDIKDFFSREWTAAKNEHYGGSTDWKTRKIILKATDENGTTVGVVKIKIEAGVADIEAVVVANDKRGQGIGKLLIRRSEQTLRNAGVHYIELVTGRDWPAVDFYKSLGYELKADMPKFYHKKPFVWFNKLLD